MLLLLLNYVVLRAIWKIDVYLIGTLVNNKSRYNVQMLFDAKRNLSCVMLYLVMLCYVMLCYDTLYYDVGLELKSAWSC